MARVALAAQDFSFIFRFAVVAPKTILERFLPQYRAFGVIRQPWLVVGRHVSARNHNGIALDGLLVHHPGMASRASFSLSSLDERFHMFPMAHQQAHLLDGRRKIAGS